MKELFDFINNEISKIEEQLKSETHKSKLIELRNKYLDFKFLLEIYEKYDLKRKNIYEIIPLPETKTFSSEYRVIDDLDIEDRKFWEEVEINYKPLRLNTLDIIIKKK